MSILLIVAFTNRSKIQKLKKTDNLLLLFLFSAIAS